MARIEAAHPDTNRSRGVRVVPMGQLGAEQGAPAFILMSVAVVIVLLIACANVANLLLARSLARAREIAVRAALGAGRWRLVRQLLVESTLLALGGGALGVFLAAWGLEAMRRAMPEFVLKVLPGVDAIRVDGSALAFTLGVSLATVFVFGLLPAWQAVTPRLADALRTGGRAAGSVRRRWLRSSLVVGEVTVSVALLVTTGLVGRSVTNLLDHDPGFDKDRLLALSVSLPASRYPTTEAREAFRDDFTERVGTLPGVEAVGLVNTLPFSTSNETTRFRFEGDPPGEASLARVDVRLIGGDYFAALGVPLLQGRVLTDRDDRAGQRVAVVNRAFARRHAGAGDPLGRRIEVADDEANLVPFTIVGVVGDVGVHQTRGVALLAAGQAPDERAVPRVVFVEAGFLLDHLRAVETDAGLTGNDQVAAQPGGDGHAADPDQAVYDVAPMTEMVANSLVAQTLASSLMRVFGFVALVLSSLGLYGVLAYLIGQRTQEIGVRVALGATRADVLALVLRQSFRLVAVGLALGLGLAAGAAQALAALLYGVGPLDPLTYVATAAAMLLVGLAATVVPARHALAVNPVAALRAE